MAGFREALFSSTVKRIASKAVSRFKGAEIWYDLNPLAGEYHATITITDPGTSRVKDIVDFLLAGLKRSGAYDVSAWGKRSIPRVGGTYR